MKTGTIALLILLAASTAAAGINTDKPLGPLNLYVYEDGTGIIVHDGDEPFGFDGYAIASASGAIAHANWITIPDNCAADPFGPGWLCPPDPFGMPPYMRDCSGWATLADGPSMITEAHLTWVATMPAGASLPLGAAFPGGTQADLTFTYVNAAAQGSYEGRVIPEPSAIALLALGALAAARRRR